MNRLAGSLFFARRSKLRSRPFGSLRFLTDFYKGKASRTRIMGVPVSIKREKATLVLKKETSYEFSFASYSTTGTLHTSVIDSGTSNIEDMDTEIVEATVAKVTDLKDGEMKTVDLDGKGKALLVKEDGKFYAVGHKCTHYGAPLSTGALSNGRVRCPWHCACFNVKTGDIEDFPGLDSIPVFEVWTEGEDVKVKATKEQLKSHKRVKAKTRKQEQAQCQVDGKKRPVFVIVGGGPAAMKAAETLREQGFNGRVVMVSKEPHYPYDRPVLSKKLHLPASEMKLRGAEYFQEHDIEFIGGKEAVALDSTKKIITISGGDKLEYDNVLIATGGKPRTFKKLPGAHLENILVLRSPEDANKIAEMAPGCNAVVIGNSFIGLEVAAYLSDKAKSVTVVSRSEIPFAALFGKEIGDFMKGIHKDNGVKFVSGTTAKEFKGKDGKLTSIVLTNGDELEADVCILGIGVEPSTEFLEKSGVELDKKGSIIVDEYLKAKKVDGVYAAGDIAHFPLEVNGEKDMVTIGHWQIAHKHGATAALNMLGQQQRLNTVPFFWTMQYGRSVRYSGHAQNFDEVVMEGDNWKETKKFIAYFVKGDKILAVATMGRDPVAAKAANLMFDGRMFSYSEYQYILSKHGSPWDLSEAQLREATKCAVQQQAKK